jgi:hypothetical protein
MNLLIFTLLSCAFAQDFSLDKESGKAVPNFIGEAKLVKGSVFKTRSEAKPVGIQNGAKIYAGDIVQTSDSSFVRLSMVDKTTINLGPASSINFESFNFKDEFNRQSTYEFIGGQMRALIKNRAAPDDIRFKVKSYVMGVRGTELLINHRQVKGLNVSEFALLEGKAEVEHDQQETMLEAKDRLVIVEHPERKTKASEQFELNAADVKGLAQVDGVMEFFEPSSHPAFEALAKSLPTATQSATDKTVSPERARGTLKNLEILNEEMREGHKKKKGL